MNAKKVKFNLFLATISQTFFPNEKIYLNLNIISKSGRLRNIQNNENSGTTIKSICNLATNNPKKIVKYECEFETNGEEIINVKSLDTFEINSQKYEIQKSSFLHLLYKNNLQDAKEEIFNKPLYILEDSIVNNNEKEFNITGNLNEEEFNYNDLYLQFHSDKNNLEIKDSNCYVIKSNENKYILNCIPGNKINSNIIDGYSNLGDGNLIVIFKKEENTIEMGPNQDIRLRDSSKKLSIGIIVAIIISAVVIILALILLPCLLCKKKKELEKKNNDNNNITNNTNNTNNEKGSESSSEIKANTTVK